MQTTGLETPLSETVLPLFLLLTKRKKLMKHVSHCAFLNLAGFLLAISFLFGCSDAESRRRAVLDTLKSRQQHAQTPAMRGVNQLLISKLEWATAESLRTPELAVVRAWESESKLEINIQWIESFPTPDALKLFSPSLNTQCTLRMTALARKNNEKEARQSVIFYEVFWFEKDSELGQQLLAMFREGDTLAVLCKDGKETSKEHPVQFEVDPKNRSTGEERQATGEGDG